MNEIKENHRVCQKLLGTAVLYVHVCVCTPERERERVCVRPCACEMLCTSPDQYQREPLSLSHALPPRSRYSFSFTVLSSLSYLVALIAKHTEHNYLRHLPWYLHSFSVRNTSARDNW